MPDHTETRLRGPVLVVGDLVCDHYVWGDVNRVSPEAPVQILEWEREANRAGGAANVALNLASLGGKVRLVGLVGDDDDGRWLVSALERGGVDVEAIVTSRSRPTTRKLRIIARGQQLLRVDREVRNPADRPDERALIRAIRRQRRGASGIICSDYAKGVLGPAALDQLLRTQRATHAKDPPPLALVDPKSRSFERYRGADILTPNQRELIEATGGPGDGSRSLADRARQIRRTTGAGAILVTRGACGMDLFEFRGRRMAHVHVPVFRTHDVFDVTGAGDTVAAVMGIEAFAGRPLPDAARLANAAAGLVVNSVGTTVVDREALERVTQGALAASGSKIVTRSALTARLRSARDGGARIVFTNGCFDVLHTGHLHLLQRARALGDLLVVAVNDDQSVTRLKGPGRPVVGQDERAEVLAALSCVDYVTVFSESTPRQVIKAVAPDVLVKGADYAIDNVVGREIVERRGGRVELIPLLPGFSTTSLVEGIQTSKGRR